MGSLVNDVLELRRKKKQTTSDYTESNVNTVMNIRRKKLAEGVDSDYVQTYLTDSQTFFTQAQSDFADLNWATGSDKARYSSRKATAEDLQERSGKIRAYLGINQDAFDKKTYKALLSQLDSDKNNYGIINQGYDDAYNIFSKYDSQESYDAAMRHWDDFQSNWGHYLADDNFGKASANRNYVNPTEEDLRYYDAMLDNSNWHMDANGVYRDVFDNEIPLQGSGEVVHPLQDDERFAVKDPVGFYLSMDQEQREGMAYEDWVKDSKRLGQILTKGTHEHWEQLSEDDLNIYYGLLGTQGLDKAMEYIDFYAEHRNAQWGAAEAQKIKDIENDFLRVSSMGLLGLQVGGENWGTGVALALGEDVGSTSGYQYASNAVSQSLDGIGKYAYDATVTVGNMLPSILISKGIGSAGIGAAAMGTSAGGHAYAQGLQEGMSEGQARNYGFLIGASESLLQYLIGGIGELGGITDDLLLSKVAMIDNSLLRVSAKLGINIGSEIFEEELQLFLEPAFKSILTGEDYDAPKLDAMIETAIVTALSTGMLEGGSTVATDITENAPLINSGRTVMEADPGAAKLLNLARKMGAGAESGFQKTIEKQAGGVSKKMAVGSKSSTTARMVGRLYDTVQTAVSSNNKGDIVKSLTRKGIPMKKATAIAEAMIARNTAIQDLIVGFQQQGHSLEDASRIAAKMVDEGNGSITTKQLSLLNAYKNDIRVKNAETNILLNEQSTLGQRNATISEYETNLMTEQLTAELEKQGVAPETAAQLAEMAVQGTMPQVNETSVENAAPVAEQVQSAQGQVLYEGQPVQVAKVKSAEGGKLLMELADGASVDAAQLSFPDQGQQELYQTVAKIADSAGTANLLLAGLDEGNASAGIYARAIEQAYVYGRHQIPLAQLQAESPYAQALTPKQLEQSYALGLAAGQKETDQRQDALQKGNKRTTAKKGQLHYEGDRGKLTERQKVSLRTCEVIAKTLGIDVYVFESQKGEDSKRIGDNGWYDPKDGSIHIDLYAGQNGEGVMVFTLAHELVHFIKDWSPAKFRKLAGFLAEQYGKKGVSIRDLVLEKQAKAKEDGRKLSFDQAYEEWVADSMETMLTDGTVVEKLSQLQATDKGLAQKIRDYIKGFVQRLKNAYKGISAQTKEGQIVSEMVDAAQQLQDLFADALIDASNTYRSTEKNTTDDGGVRYQTRYDGIDLANDQNVYTWDFLINAPDMQTTILPEVNSVRDSLGKVDTRTVIDAGLKNAENVGAEIGGKVFVRNTYTGRNLRVDTASIRHGLNGDSKRILTNARLGAVIGDVVKNAIPINALYNKASGVKGTYAMAAYARDSKSREFVAIVTVEERNGEIAGVEAYDVTHALSGRQKNSSRADTKSQGVNPSTTAKISIAEFLYTVKSTHQSILSSDVLANIGGAKDGSSYYALQSKFSSRAADGISPRELLLNTVEGMVANDTEYKKLQEYRRKIKELNSTEEQLERLNQELKKQFAEGGRDYETINKLEALRRKAIDKLNRYDSELINLENTKPIRDIVNRMKQAAYQKGFQKAKDYYKQKSDAREEKLKQHYQESRRNAVERHDKAQIRQQIRKDVERLASLLNKGNKQKNVKQELQAFAGAALRTAQGTFLNNYNEYDMVRNGLNATMNREQKQIFQRCQELLAELDKVREEIYAEPGPDNLHDKWDPEAELRRDDREEALKKELSKNMRILRDAGLFRTENELMEDSKAEQLMDELLKAYAALQDSELAHVRGVFSQVIYDQIDNVKKFLTGKAVKDMTTVELKELQKMYRMVLHTVTTSNELFAQKRKADVRKLGEEIITQLQDPGKAMTPELLDRLKKMGWSMLKPATALEVIGSDTLTELMQGLYRGEDTYALDIDHARKYAKEQADKYGRKNWDLETAIPFAGTKITLGQAMSLYAYTRRQQSQGHLEGDGFTHASNVRIKTPLGRLPIKLKYIMNATKTHTVNKQMYAKVAELLTEPQRKYVDGMVEYLSKTMGAKGNEVSMVLYGIELFGEKYYLPIRTASEFHEEALGATTGEVKLKNNGFTKKVQEGASNPIVLEDFESVWAAHVDKMSLYHGFVLPMEDFDRVYNYHRTAEEDVTDAAGEVYKKKLVDTNETVKVDIENKAGKTANAYIEQFMQQLNGGVRGDSTEKLFGGLIRNFKKTAVLGSLSVAIQQPTAFVRAMAYLDIQDIADWKNWLGKSGKPDGKLVEEMYKYAPVALMKRIGGFDPGLGRTSQEYMLGNKRGALGAVENALGMLPEKMDEWTWTYIWLCTKRQIHRRNPGLRVGSKEFCEKAGERFSQIIRDSQVYDSVLVKSQIMRSKNIFLQMATAFMNEPTTSMDMYIRSTVQAKRGKISKKQLARTYGAVIGSQIFCGALAAFVYAARDDDEDETYWEKYLDSFIGKSVEGILPWFNIPFVKDIVSVFQGYDVERSDMSIITDIYQGWKKLQSDDATAWEKTEAFAGSILNLFGIPLKNVSRDVRGIYNTIDHMINPRTTATKAGLRYAAKAGLTGKATPKTEQMYNAIVDNDAAHILRLMATYNTEDSAQAAVCTAVKDSYVSGKITEERALDMLQIYGGVDQTDAQEKVMYYEFQKQYPDSDLGESAALKWYTELQDTGISLDIYTEYCAKKKGYTKKTDIMEVIDSLDLTGRQKDELYLSAGYAESTIEEAPWH